MHTRTIFTYKHLEALGFGLNELDYLRNIVKEIGLANGIAEEDGVKKLLRDLEDQYHRKLGFESKIESLRVEVEKLSQEGSRLRVELLSLPFIGTKLVKLTQSGVSEQDIINVSAVFEKYISKVDRDSFVTELEKYRGLKSTIQKLSDEASKLRSELAVLQTQKEELNTDVQTMLSSLVESVRSFDLLNGLLASSKNNILTLVSTVACLVYLRNLQFGYLQNTKTDHTSYGIGEFESLSRAYSGEQGVSTKDVMKDPIKAIEFMQDKPDLNDKLREALSSVRATLLGVTNT
jgi:DNA repair exonuclease SbcCD ATPase subunit